MSADGGGDERDQAEEPSYAEALDELEDLLDELEGADVDVDVLADRVARGVELIRLCRARLDVVTTDVDAVVAELIPAASGDPDQPADSQGFEDPDDPVEDVG